MHARFNEIRLSLSGETDLGPEESSAATTKYAYFNGFQPVALMGVYMQVCMHMNIHVQSYAGTLTQSCVCHL